MTAPATHAARTDRSSSSRTMSAQNPGATAPDVSWASAAMRVSASPGIGSAPC